MKDKKFRNYLIIGSILVVVLSVCSYALIEFITNVIFMYNPEYDPISAIGMIVPMGTIICICISLFSKKIYKYVDKLIDGLEQVSKGNYNIQLDINKSGPFSEVYDNFNKMVNELNNICYMNEDFINNFSHEFKTPIVSINGFAELLLNTDCSKEIQKKYLTIIYNESKRLSDLSQNTLLLSKLESTGILTDKEEYKLDEQIKQCMILLYCQAELKNINVELNLKKYYFFGNKELINHIWINIISNAIKYTDKGGLITIGIKKTSRDVEVSIEDTGHGMSKEVISHIFERFYREEKARSVEGNGLGLSIVKSIIDLHHGKIDVISQVDVGSTFIVKLPSERKSFDLKEKLSLNRKD